MSLSVNRRNLIVFHEHVKSTAINRIALQGETADNPAIIILVGYLPQDWSDLEIAIKSMDYYLVDRQTSDLLLFHEEGTIPADVTAKVSNWTHRHVFWHSVNFTSFPPGFNPDNETSTKFRKRSQWGYQQMCRFWIYGLWQHEAIRNGNYTTLLRMDTDSCFLRKAVASDTIRKQQEEQKQGLPYLPKHIVYKAQLRANGEKLIYTEGLMNLTLDFIRQHNVKIQNPHLWKMAEETLTSPDPVLPLFYNNLEVDRIEFFRDRPLVRSYLYRVAEEAPYGVLRLRWGDAPVRFLTMALFASPEHVDILPANGYVHGDRCRRYARKTNLLQEPLAGEKV